ncbi:GXWXG domain-containing protein [Ensifer sp. NPDC090286]|uniref:GXWXG domain-containing protein n=1 Tax=Ensifer sp. NPDC090286 TaxID=3363991 RepID=UPI00383A0C4D
MTRTDRPLETSGHPFDSVLENRGWFGKRFTPELRADALLFWTGEQWLAAMDAKKVP